MNMEQMIADTVAKVLRPMLDEVQTKLTQIQSTPAVETYNPDRLYTDAEAAALLNIAVQTLRQWRAQAEGIPFVKLGSSVRYRAKDIRAYLDRSTSKVMDDKGRVRG